MSLSYLNARYRCFLCFIEDGNGTRKSDRPLSDILLSFVTLPLSAYSSMLEHYERHNTLFVYTVKCSLLFLTLLHFISYVVPFCFVRYSVLFLTLCHFVSYIMPFCLLHYAILFYTLQIHILGLQEVVFDVWLFNTNLRML